MKTITAFNTKFATIAMTLLCPLAIPVHADTITVTNTNDSGLGSLRQALADANDGDTIDFAVTGSIGLTSGELLVDKSITISGPGAVNLAVDGNGNSRVFHASIGETVIISGLTITNGNASGPYPDDLGGGIYNDHATLRVTNCSVNGNLAFYGGGIYNDGSDDGSATLEISNTDISDNVVEYESGGGGGVYNTGQFGDATLIITGSTISGNVAPFGGGIHSGGRGVATVMVNNSTLSGNSAVTSGGGIINMGYLGTATIQISNSTLRSNSAKYAGGIYNYGYNGSASLQIGQTILDAGVSGDNIGNVSGSVMSLGYNISSDGGGGYLNGPGDHVNTDPLLGPLQDNGGPTFTHELLLGSPAIDAGDPSFTPPPFYDQRSAGFYRVRNGRIDIGSFELQAGTRAFRRPRPTPYPRPTPR